MAISRPSCAAALIQRATGEIGLIKVLKEGSVSSGVRRLEAVTGEGSLRHFRRDHALENVVATLVHGGDDQSPAEALRHELDRREEELKKLRKELEHVRMKSASTSVQSAAENVREVKGVKVLATRADNLERAQLRVLIDNLRNKLGSGVVVLGSVNDGKVALIVGVTKDLTSRVQAGKIIAEVAKKVGGSGGGRPTWLRPAAKIRRRRRSRRRSCFSEAKYSIPGDQTRLLSGAFHAILYYESSAFHLDWFQASLGVFLRSLIVGSRLYLRRSDIDGFLECLFFL